jgi:hypothetical protein
LLHVCVDLLLVDFTLNFHVVAGVHLSEVLLELSDGASSQLVADTGSRNLHRSASDRVDSLPVRFFGVHARLDVLSI